MKAVLEFNLPEDNDDFKLATRASKLFCIIWDLKNEVRKRWKYSEYKHDETSKEIEELYTAICDIIGDSMDDIS